jgi:RNA polymerase subunit RPABC4/transcription elongation factor Spt4
MSDDEIVQKDHWICPSCLSKNSTSALECDCGIAISENDVQDFREDITPTQLFSEADSLTFIGADEKAFILRYYLQMRFPDSSEAKRAKDKVNIDDDTEASKYLELLNKRSQEFSKAQEVVCGRCGATNLYDKKRVQCVRCGDWLHQYLSSMKAEPLNMAIKVETGDSIRCPKCSSTQITAQKQGFGIGKAVIGTLVSLPVGVASGFIRARKIYLTCLKCGHRFKPG